MEELQFCAKCGRNTLVWDGLQKWSCRNCDYVLYHNVAAAVAVLIKHQDEVLFTRRNQEPKKGKLDLAGGFVDPHESAEETCARELFEEMGLRVDIAKLKFLLSLPNIYEFKKIPYHTLDLFFEYEVAEKFDVQPEQAEISETVWLRKEDIKIEDIAFESQRRFFERFKES